VSFLLDTNVISEVMRTSPDARVVEWLNISASAEIYLCSVTIAEISYGLEAMPPGQRREDVTSRFRSFIEQGFAGRVLPFDENSAHIYGEIMAQRRSIGRPMSALDGQIAAIARLNVLTVATRDFSGFESTGVDLINPWAHR
jgi:hypothetical protein